MPSRKFTEPAVGDMLAGRYILEKELGRGGFGIVFRATHVDTRRTVAVKILLATHARADSKAVERFRREAILSASLEYPNTVDVFDYGETDEGIFFLVMEYLRGTPLSEVIDKEAPLQPHRVVHITRQLLYSLMEAHAKDIVHRDVKPENIMIVPLMYDANYVKVMDFGIAKMVSGGLQITQAGQTFGTPRYMAAEQLQGGMATPSTDLYAVGLIVYEMLMGRPAIDSENLASTITRVISGPPIALDPEMEVPEAFHKVVRRASARQAEDRFSSSEDFLEALNAWTGPSPEVLAVMSPEDGEDFIKRQRDLARLDAPTQALGISRAQQIFGRQALPPEADTIPPGVQPAYVAQGEYDPLQTSLVPTHADAGKAPAATLVVSTGSEAATRPPDPASEPHGDESAGLKTGCLVVSIIVILGQAAAILVLLLMVFDVIRV